MNIAIDIETIGLNAKRFIFGIIHYRDYKNREVFEKYYTPNEMWDGLIKIAEKNHKKKIKTNVYGHNIAYDFYGMAQNHLQDKELEYFVFRPFIVSYKKYNLNFYDTFALFPMSLKALGEAIQYEKFETPEDFLFEKEFISKQDDKEYIKEILKDKEIEMTKYCQRDCEIVLKSLDFIQDSFQEFLNFKPQRLITAGQLAMTSFKTFIKKNKIDNQWFDLTYRTKRPNDEKYFQFIKKSHRGGIVEASKIGEFRNAIQIDINSSYPYEMINNRFPNLESETYINDPLNKINHTSLEVRNYTQDEILNKIGVSKCFIHVPNIDYPILQVIKDTEVYMPNRECFIEGVWTNAELKYAKELGYKIIRLEETVIYEEGVNPFKEYISELYKQREKSPIKKAFYKSLMNNLAQKFSQTNDIQEKVWVKPKDYWRYMQPNTGYKIKFDFDNEILFTRKLGETYPNHTHPIISSLVTAYGRIRLVKDSYKIPKNKMLYRDTDSLMFEKFENWENKFEFNNNLGEYKIEQENGCGIIYGEKKYFINNAIKVSGIPKSQITIDKIKSNNVIYKRMIGISDNVKKAGEFESVEVDFTINQDNLRENKVNELISCFDEVIKCEK